MKKSLSLSVNGKINLALNVLGRQEGLHRLDTVMLPVNLKTHIKLARAEKNSVKFCSRQIKNSNAEKALNLLSEEFGFCCAAEVHSGIPSGCGFGSSSADAAGIILGYNRLFELNLPPEKLSDIGQKIGSDVPYMLLSGAMRLTGTGTELKRLKNAYTFSMLAAVRGGINTGACFLAYDQGKVGENTDIDALCEALNGGELNTSLLTNALYPAAVSLNPAIEAAHGIFCAHRIPALMTGSGAAVLGLTAYKNQRDPEKSKKIVLRRQIKKAAENLSAAGFTVYYLNTIVTD